MLEVHEFAAAEDEAAERPKNAAHENKENALEGAVGGCDDSGDGMVAVVALNISTRQVPLPINLLLHHSDLLGLRKGDHLGSGRIAVGVSLNGIYRGRCHHHVWILRFCHPKMPNWSAMGYLHGLIWGGDQDILDWNTELAILCSH